MPMAGLAGDGHALLSPDEVEWAPAPSIPDGAEAAVLYVRKV